MRIAMKLIDTKNSDFESRVTDALKQLVDRYLQANLHELVRHELKEVIKNYL